MHRTAICVEHVSKLYKLGVIGSGSLRRDFERWMARARGQPDPTLLIGQEALAERYGESILALNDVSFEVEQGEAIGVIGRNGAGKSTLLKILSRVTAPSAGVVKMKGRVGSLLEVGTGFHPELTGRENIYLNGAILGMRRAEINKKFDQIVDFSGVEQFIDTPVKRYSSGMYVRLAFAVAAYLEPEILIVDEVLAVGDDEFQKKCLGKMSEVTGQGRTVLFVSHNMAAIESLCNQTIYIANGKIKSTGKSSSIIADYLNEIKINLFDTHISERKDRSGTGDVIISDFWVENGGEEKSFNIQTGQDISFVFKLKPKSIISKNQKIDVGFSIHNSENNQTIAVLYSSYQNKFYFAGKRELLVKCTIKDFSIAPGKYRIGARILADGDEADNPSEGIALINVEEGDFFGTGRIGFGKGPVILMKGQWGTEK